MKRSLDQDPDCEKYTQNFRQWIQECESWIPRGKFWFKKSFTLGNNRSGMIRYAKFVKFAKICPPSA